LPAVHADSAVLISLRAQLGAGWTKKEAAPSLVDLNNIAFK
jgi:hypothetical protein